MSLTEKMKLTQTLEKLLFECENEEEKNICDNIIQSINISITNETITTWKQMEPVFSEWVKNCAKTQNPQEYICRHPTLQEIRGTVKRFFIVEIPF